MTTESKASRFAPYTLSVVVRRDPEDADRVGVYVGDARAAKVVRAPHAKEARVYRDDVALEPVAFVQGLTDVDGRMAYVLEEAFNRGMFDRIGDDGHVDGFRFRVDEITVEIEVEPSDLPDHRVAAQAAVDGLSIINGVSPTGEVL
jgi:hypothetical protein